MLTSFDHVTIAVAQAEAAVERYTRLLGRPPTWRGAHAELGTEGAIFGLSNAAIEIVAPRAGAEEAEGLQALLADRGDGLQALAFGTEDAQACSAALRARGVRASPAQDGEARGDDGTTRAYRTVDLSPRSTRGLAVLVVERPPGSTLRSTADPATGGAEALDHVVLRTSDADAAAALYGRDLGVRLALDRVFGSRRLLFFRIGGVTIEVAEDTTVGPVDAFGGLAYRTREIDAARARLAAAGFDVSEVRDGAKPGTRVFTVRDGTCGVPTLFIRDPAREGR
jgi:catechol 2,3-dioxygenase-like lactoylglutathione lyase family enzyme